MTHHVHTQEAQRRALIIIRVLYFVYFAALGVYYTFINVYFRSIGLSGTQIGAINTLSPLVAMFSGALWGLLSDRFGKTRRLLMIATVGAMLSALALSSATSFGSILAIVAVFSLFSSAIIPLVDSTTLMLLGERRDRYGSLRIWGSIGFILTSSVIGFVVAETGLTFIFYAYAVLFLVQLIVLLGLRDQSIRLGGSVLRGLGDMMRRPPWLLFAVSALLIGITGNGMSTFLSVTIDVMGGPDALIGLSWTVAALSELPVMALSGRWQRRFGAPRLLAVAFGIYAVRMILYSLMPSPFWVLGINLLGGMSFALYWTSAVTYANDLAPDHLKATSQGLLMAIANLAGVTGSLLSGWLFDAVGPSGLFGVLAVVAAAALALFVGGRLVIRSRASRYAKG